MAQMMTNFTAADMPGANVKKAAPAPKAKAPKVEAPKVEAPVVEEVLVAEEAPVLEESAPVAE
jgi:hypothetical protein